MTALVIIISGAYAVDFEPDPKDASKTVPVRLALQVAGEEIAEEDAAAMLATIPADKGARLTSMAMDRQIPYFRFVLALAVALFAYSTMISWSYYGERCWAYLFGDNSSMVYRVIFLAFVFLGSIVSATNVLEFGDLMILGMAFPNIIGLLMLSGGVAGDLKSYWQKYTSGEIKRTDK